MPLLNLQLDSRPEVNRDISVELTAAATGRKMTLRPFMDGSLSVANIDAGDWRIKVRHPNLTFDIADRLIRVFRDRPTFVPVKLPKDLLENAPIRDVADADFGPTRLKLSESEETAQRHARKLAGQPIYADDWNELSQTLAATARAASEITTLASPQGHNHPELEAKLAEVQGNLERITDVFGTAIAQLQRAQQIDALRTRTDNALDALNAALAVDAATRTRINRIFDTLSAASEESPATFGTRLAAAAGEIDDILEDLSARRPPAVREQPDVRGAREGLQFVVAQPRARTPTDELVNQQRFKRANLILRR
jgi:hypothetical protein